MSGENVLAFDTETRGFSWWAGETAFIATTADDTREWSWDLSKPDEVEAFKRQLEWADVIVAHNLSFDVHQVRATIGLDILELGAVLHDTDIMARVAWPEGSYGEHGGFGLKNLAKVFIDPTADAEEKGIAEAAKAIDVSLKSTPGAYYDVWRAYPDVMETYAKADARYTWDLFALLEKDLNSSVAPGQNHIYYEVEQPIMSILIRAEQHGTAVNPAVVTRLRRQYMKEAKVLRRELERDLGAEALGGKGSEAALEEALLKQGVPLHRLTDTGKLSTAQYALAEFKAEHPVIEKFLDLRHTEKFLSTYVEPMVDRQSVNPSFRQIGAWTGRMSCMRPNMQNIPVRSGPEVREAFVPRPGHKLIVADFDSIEVRLLAYYLGPEGESYRALLNSGHDPHQWMADRILERGLDVGRSKAKNALFAIVYGAGGCKLCEQQGFEKGPPLTSRDWVVQKGYKQAGEPSCKQGTELAKLVKASIPGYMSLMRRIQNKIKDQGYVTTIMGRKQAVAADKSYVGMSALIQGSAADVMKVALADADTAVKTWGGRILLVVHDEIVAEVPENDADHALKDLIYAMENAYELNPPLHVTGATATDYGSAK